MFTLYCFGENFGIHEPSPFTLKIDLLLRMSGIPYQSITDVNNLRHAPKGKLPYAEDNGQIIADSFFITEHLKRFHGLSLDAWLTEQQKAVAHLITKSLDENFYWCIVHSRWVPDDTWSKVKEAFFGSMPFPLKLIIPGIARKSVKTDLVRHGIGKHSDDEIMLIAKHSLDSLSQLLGEQDYMLGDKISSLDATAYAFLAQVILVDLDNELTQMAREYKNLLDYCHRIHQGYYQTE